MSMDKDYYDHSQYEVELSVQFLSETEKAIRVDMGDGEGDQWMPKSICRMSEEDPDEGDFIEIFIPEWFALKEGLI